MLSFLCSLNAGAIVGIVIASIITALLLFIFLFSFILYRAALRKNGFIGKIICKKFEREINDYKIDFSWWDKQNLEKLVMSNNGEKLIAYLIRAKSESSRVAIVIHGYFGTHKDVMPQAKILLENGYNIIAPDLRTHGESDGKNITMGYLDKNDLILWINKAIEMFGKDCQIVLVGESMGAAIVCSASDIKIPNVKCIVADSGYKNAYSEMKFILNDWGKIPSWPVLPVANWFSKIFNNCDLKKVNPIASVEKGMMPILFIHGTLDRFVPCYMSKDMYEKSEKNKCELYLVDEAGHIKSFAKDPKKYKKTMINFIDKWIK